MSYDLMVFEPLVPPRDREGFMAWFREQTSWSEGHDYNDPANTSPGLRAWFIDMTKGFPAMNGPYASKDYYNNRVSDYSHGRSIIYVAFAWSEAEAAYRTTFDLAKKHKLGFYDASGDRGEVWMPTATGGYTCAHKSDPADASSPEVVWSAMGLKVIKSSEKDKAAKDYSGNLPKEVLDIFLNIGKKPPD